jgi:NAD-dependent dihydropyrimidine dehydrogenase PreA subunit
MKHEGTVWWFSGTGNSLVVARELARLLDARCEPMTRFLDGSVAPRRGEDCILVFPSYFGAIPAIVARFAAAASESGPASATAIATYGGGAGEAYDQLGGIFGAKGIALRSRYGLHLPQNSFSKPWEDDRALFARVLRERLPKLAREIEAGEPTDDRDQAALGRLMAPLRPWLRSLYRKALLKSAGIEDDPALSNRDLLGPSDRSYRALEACTGCGLCARLCPVANIEMSEGRPRWTGHCEGCLSCYNHCPARAIAGGLSARAYFYRNPLIGPSALEVQRSRREGAPKEA